MVFGFYVKGQLYRLIIFKIDAYAAADGTLHAAHLGFPAIPLKINTFRITGYKHPVQLIIFKIAYRSLATNLVKMYRVGLLYVYNKRIEEHLHIIQLFMLHLQVYSIAAQLRTLCPYHRLYVAAYGRIGVTVKHRIGFSLQIRLK